MKRLFFKTIITCLTLLFSLYGFSQINTGSPAVPFGSNTNYKYGIMPTNLPTGGTYGASQKAADAYNAWKGAYVTTCTGGKYRVYFDDSQYTVSEGIAYGMLLSVYASDKAVFDGLWAYYKQFSNGNGVMDWKISGCNSVNQGGGATDAELDAAMALVIAAEQWPSGSVQYTADAKTLIQAIKNTEMTSGGQTLNGDLWGNTNTCRNPSYQAPAYYTEFAKIDTGNGTFWSSTAVSAASTLLTANRNSTSGLVSNWSDNNGSENSCGNTGSGAAGYGADACRNPWRTAVDYLWHGTSASAASKDINTKLTAFVNGYENQLKGPFANRNVTNPSSGSYVNGSYSTFALPPMTSTSAQSSLNKCYTAVASLADVDAYFNSTIRCITMFTLTGNFWAPGASGFVFPPTVSNAVTDATGKIITLTTNKLLTSSTPANSTFIVYYNGIAQTTSSVSVSGSTITVNVSTAPAPGQAITISYTGTTIKSTENAALATFTKISVLNMIEGNETILDDCDDGNELNNVGGIWFTFNDAKDQNAACTPGIKSTITPLTSETSPFAMSAPGYNSSAYAVNASIVLGTNYKPYNGGSCATWTNPAYVGIGTWVDDVETNTMDWRSGTGVSFWYKGPATTFQVIIFEVKDYCFHKVDVPAAANWTKVTVLWGDLAQPTWGTPVAFTAQHVQKLQWQFEKGNSADGTFWIDDVRIMNMPPVELTALQIGVKADSKIQNPLTLTTTSTDTLELEVTTTPADASYPVVFWSSSDESVVTVDYLGRIFVQDYGEAVITARSKMHQNVSATYTVKVPPPAIKPTSITFTPSTYSLEVGQSELLIPTFYSAAGSVTETGLTWTSSNPAIASVTSSGTVTAVSTGGPVTITATSTATTSVKSTVSVTVIATGVNEITVDKTSVDLIIGESSTVTPTVLPVGASDKTVSWSTLNANVVTVTNGVISSTGVGSTTVRVTSNNNPAVFVDIPVTVSGIAITGVTVAPTTASVVVGASTTLVSAVLPSNATQTVTWSSDTPGVATVTGGVVTGVSVGTATITITSTEDLTKSTTAVITVTPKTVTSITVTPATKSLIIAETVQLSATVLPIDASDKTYTWSSSDPLVATVDASGFVTAVAAGSANIIATSNDGSGVTGTCAVTVTNQLVSSIDVTSSLSTIVVGETTTVSASVLPIDATNKTYTWSSSDPLVATVDASGLVTAVSAGLVNIIATANDAGAITGSVSITITDQLVTGITVTPSTSTLVVDGTVQLGATVAPTNATDKTYTWSSSDPLVATVSATGFVTAVGVGTANIIATANDGSIITGVCALTVTPKLVTSITVSTATTALVIGGTTQMSATVVPATATDATYTWSSSDPLVATVSASGLVTAVGVGSANIIATANDASGVTGLKAVTVTNQLVTGITITPSTSSVVVGATVQLSAIVAPTNATDKTYTWSSSNPLVATVSATGFVTTLTVGTANIIATANDGSTITGTCALTVTPKLVTSITLNKTTSTLNVGGSETLTATVLPTTATDATFTWSSSDPLIATVSTAGLVTAVSAGTVTITATANDASGISTSCAYTISNVLPLTVATSPSIGFTIGDPSQTLTATVLPANTTDKSVSWVSSDPLVATVDAVTGEVTPVAVGTCVITVSCTSAPAVVATCDVEVVASVVLVTGVTLDQSTLSIGVGGTATLTATVLPVNATNKAITWSSSDASVTVANGVVTGISLGSATITATSVADGTKLASCLVTVSATSVASITLSSTTLSLTPSSLPTTITATVLPIDATNPAIDWISSDPLVATVVNGVVSVVGIGTATITATATDGSGISTTCAVTVSAIPVVSVSLDQTTLSLAQTSAPVTLVATVNPTDASDKTVSWSTSNPLVATVANGVVTVVGLGTADITVTTTDGSKTAICAVTVSATPVTDITLTPTSITMTMADAPATISAAILPIDASDKSLTWTSDNTSAVTVSNGVVTAVGIGSATITATANDGSGISATCVVTVNSVPVVSVSLDQTTLSLAQTSAPTTLIATVNPTTATNQAVSWTSSNPLVVTVANGVVTVVGIGTANVTVTTTEGGFSDVCAVTVSSIPVTGITPSQTSLNLLANSTPVTITAVIAPSDASDKSLQWVSANPAVVTVVNGIVSVVGVGSTTITATANDGSGISVDIPVVISPVIVTGISVDNPTLTLTVGGSAGLITPTILPADATNQSVTWVSSTPGVATVVNGTVTAVSAGTTTITVTSVDGNFSATTLVTVSDQWFPVTSVSLDQTDLTLALNETAKLTPSFNPANASDQTVTWASSNPSAATVDNMGNITPVGVGTTIITATSNDNNTAIASANVAITDILTTSITIDNTSAVFVGASATLSASVLPIGASTSVTWVSSNPSIVSVNSATGEITGESAGSAIITATATDGTTIVSNNCTVTVSLDITPVSSITFDPSAVYELSETGTLDLSPMLQINPTGASVQSIVWSASSPYATVNATSGVVTGAAVPVDQLVTITVTVTDIGGTQTVKTVKVTVKKDAILVQSITIPATLNVASGGTATIATTSILPAIADNKVVTWSISSGSGGTIDPLTGLITVTGAVGDAFIVVASATDGSSITSNQCIVTIIQQVVNIVSVTSSTSALALTKGEKSIVTLTFNPTTTTQTGFTVDAGSSGVVTVTKLTETTYEVSAEKGGSQQVVLRSTANTSILTSFSVNVTEYVSSISVTSAASTLNVGGSIQASASILPATATNKAIVWESSDPSIASVDASGKITALKEGSVTISAVAQDGSLVTGTLPINVTKVAVSSIGVSNIDNLEVGSTEQISLVVYPADATYPSVTYVSSDPSVATVDANGVVTGVDAGLTGIAQAIITVSSVDNPLITQDVTVTVIPQQADKTSLGNLLNHAYIVYDKVQAGDIVIGNREGEVPSLNWTRFLTAWGDAQSIYYDNTATQDDVNSVYDELYDALVGMSYTVPEEGTAIDEVEAIEVVVYPTIITTQLTVKASEIDYVNVVSANGSLLEVVQANGASELQINTEAYAQGVYYITVKVQDQLIVKKVIK